MADANSKRKSSITEHGEVVRKFCSSDVAYPNGERLQGEWENSNTQGWKEQDVGSVGLCDGTGLQWIECPDGKLRKIEPSIRLLAHGIPNRVGKLRGLGNAIVPQAAAEFIKAFMELS